MLYKKSNGSCKELREEGSRELIKCLMGTEFFSLGRYKSSGDG